jgi:hypothetical protein
MNLLGPAVVAAQQQRTRIARWRLRADTQPEALHAQQIQGTKGPVPRSCAYLNQGPLGRSGRDEWLELREEKETRRQGLFNGRRRGC